MTDELNSARQSRYRQRRKEKLERYEEALREIAQAGHSYYAPIARSALNPSKE